jgi:hypothetical protein
MNRILTAQDDEPPAEAKGNHLKLFHPAGRGFWS